MSAGTPCELAQRIRLLADKRAQQAKQAATRATRLSLEGAAASYDPLAKVVEQESLFRPLK
jgi:hypothetical protein